jgi:hypothetical protein
MSPREREKPGLGDPHRLIVESLIDTKAVDFDAIGRAVAEFGPDIARQARKGENWFISVYSNFIRIYVLLTGATLADLAALREMGTELNK